MYKNTITLFNRYVSNGAVKWKATVLRDVDLNADVGKMRQMYGENTTTTAKLHVKYTGAEDTPYIGTNVYKPPKAFAALASKDGAITFSSGDDFDFFVVGEETFVSDISDDDYTDGFYNAQNRQSDYCYAIQSVAKYSVIPHFEILAR